MKVEANRGKPARSVTLALAVLTLAVVGCQAGSRAGEGETRPPPDEGAMAVDSLARLRALVRDAVGDSTCTQDAQCKAIAFGSKPCGGPWTYLVYSTATADSARLAEVVGRYNAYEDTLNRREGRVSDCMLVAKPALECRGGRCVERR